jgi:hypothetical protein
MAQNFQVPVQLPASLTSAAPLNIPQGSAPSSPVNGDVWITSASMFARISGATVDLAGGGGSNVPVGGGSDKVFWENDTTVTTSYTITTGKNAVSAGPITINNGATVTIPTGSEWTIPGSGGATGGSQLGPSLGTLYHMANNLFLM